MESFRDEAMAARAALLTEQLDAELERHRLEADGGAEPDLPTPHPDGPFLGIAPAP